MPASPSTGPAGRVASTAGNNSHEMSPCRYATGCRPTPAADRSWSGRLPRQELAIGMEDVSPFPMQEMTGAPDELEFTIRNKLGRLLDIRHIENGIVFPRDDQRGGFYACQVDELGHVGRLFDERTVLVETQELL